MRAGVIGGLRHGAVDAPQTRRSIMEVWAEIVRYEQVMHRRVCYFFPCGMLEKVLQRPRKLRVVCASFAMNKNWFETKEYGIGWRPVTWQGWAVSLAYLLFIVAAFMRVDRASHSASDTLIGFAPFFISATLLSVLISRMKSNQCKSALRAQKL